MCAWLKNSKYRDLIAALIMALTALLILLMPRMAHAVTLKEHSILTGDVITLGDVFGGLVENQEKVLGPAPLPGEEMTLNAATLMRIARATGLPWRPQSASQSVTLSRAATVIPKTMIEDSLRQALTDKGVPGKFELQLPPALDRLVLPQDQPASLDISDLSVDLKNSRFQAMILAPSAANPVQKIPVSGGFEKLVDVPVLRAPLSPGAIINARDLDTVEMKARDVQRDIVISQEALIGMTPRKLLLAGSAIKSGEVETPQIVARGDLITMVFRSGSLVLTAKGKALENGAMGDTIRVVNSDSNKTLAARVSASREVTVSEF